MEPPIGTDSESIRDEKVKILKAIQPIEGSHLVRGQFRGYRSEEGVAPDSQVETFAALRLEIGSWRWKGVPVYIRAGKCLPVTCTELIVRFREAPTMYRGYDLKQNYLRFRVSPDIAIAIGFNAMTAEETTSQPVEIMATRHPGSDEQDAYERVLSDAMDGDATLFARQDYVEEAWRIVDPVLKAPPEIHEYAPGTWGANVANQHVLPPGGWVDPVLTK